MAAVKETILFAILVIQLCYSDYNDYAKIEFEEAEDEMDKVYSSSKQETFNEINDKTTSTVTDYDDDLKIFIITNAHKRKDVHKKYNQDYNKTEKYCSTILTNNLTGTKFSKPKNISMPTFYDILNVADYNEKDEELLLLSAISSQPHKEDLKIELSSVPSEKINIRLNDLRNGDDNDLFPSPEWAHINNLQPAADQINLTFTRNINNVWFVPERYPCWNLPILFGRIKPSNEKDIFGVHAFTITNITERMQTDTPNYPQVDMFKAKETNKWCTTPPCFADHVSCLFPDNKNSKLCDSQYKASRPTILEQMAIVNTLNSIRNFVAKGSYSNYPYLPPAANMKQVAYDRDLESMAKRWLMQCLPGPAPCLSLDSTIGTQLECTKYASKCCELTNNDQKRVKCIPKPECSINHFIGCMYTWFKYDKHKRLDTVAVRCGHSEVSTFSLVQLLWANTDNVGCAYGTKANKDVRVVCVFAPGAPFVINTEFFCGLRNQNDITSRISGLENLTPSEFLEKMGISLSTVSESPEFEKIRSQPFLVQDLLLDWWSTQKIYEEGWVRSVMKKGQDNVTVAVTARLVTKFTFIEETGARCDTNEPVYKIGEPGAECIQTSRQYDSLCYKDRDSTQGRLLAVLAPFVLFTLILYDLFSGVIKHDT